MATRRSHFERPSHRRGGRGREAALVLDHLTAVDAASIGQTIVDLAKAWVPGRSVALHIETDDRPLFIYFMGGTGAGNADWNIKKKNVTRGFNRSSWAVRLEFLERHIGFQAERILPMAGSPDAVPIKPLISATLIFIKSRRENFSFFFIAILHKLRFAIRSVCRTATE